LIVAVMMVLAGEVDHFHRFFGEMLKHNFSVNDGQTYWDPVILCQAGLLLPEGIQDPRVPVAKLRSWWIAGKGPRSPAPAWLHPWLAKTLALLDYRTGDYEQALQRCRDCIRISNAVEEGHAPYRRQCQAGSYAVQAMTEYKLHRLAEARRFFALASTLIPADLRTLGTGEEPNKPPIDEHWLEQDFLIAELHRREAERLLLPQLPQFLKGEYQPHDNEERLTLVLACRVRGLHHVAAGLYVDAFAADPKLADDLEAAHRYQAARCAARASASATRSTADAKEPERWRTQALRWLKEDLSARTRQLERGTPDQRQVLQQWQHDPDLARVRSPEWIAGLPPEEGKEWTTLWAGVSAQVQKKP
jgi:hypothetical protein